MHTEARSHEENMASYKPRKMASEETSLADTLIQASNLQNWDNNFVIKPPSLCYSVMAALASQGLRW